MADMATRGRGRAYGCAVLLMVGLLSVGCSADADRSHSLRTALSGIDGVSEADVTSGTEARSDQIGVLLERDLDAATSVSVLRDIADAAEDGGFTTYRLEVRRSLVDQDLLVVDETFPRAPEARAVTTAWLRVSGSFLGEVVHSFEAGNERITVTSDGAAGHDVAEARRIGYGSTGTTWQFVTAPGTFLVSGPVRPRDVALFDRVQRSVVSSVLPLSALRWQLARRATHVDLDLDIYVPGGENPRRISLDRMADLVRPLALAALDTTSYAGLDRYLTIGDVANGDRDPFASWNSAGPPVRGRDPLFRGWDAWWVRLAKQTR